MDLTGFLGNLVSHAVDIDIGRKGLAPMVKNTPVVSITRKEFPVL
jgi:hypothetical protein